MIIRSQEKLLKNRLKEPRKLIQVILGPRQVGKTTLVLNILDKIEIKHIFASADNVIESQSIWIEQLWESVRLQMRQQDQPEFLLVIDEIQKISNWSEVVKKMWDEDTRKGLNIKLVLLGSSRLLIQNGLTESLAGRFEVFPMTHWNFSEMKEAFNFSVEQYIYFGAYPGAALLVEDETRWKNYVRNSLIETTISKDILMLTRIDKPALLRRLFELGCLYSGQILAFNKLLGELQDAGNTTTLSHYLILLSDSGLLSGLEKYSGTTIRKRASKPKFQVHNTALWSAQQGLTFEEIRIQPKIWGRLVQSAIGAHLINACYMDNMRLYYWRDGNDEVDFVLEKDNRIISLEVKSGKVSNTKGMSVFKKMYKPEKSLLIGGDGIPIEDFLLISPMELFN
ncbi:MAG: ATP-binding protein [Bacteroidetes bacterium]|nr:ATP-binding protein [Bacteroidota bacterium]